MNRPVNQPRRTVDPRLSCVERVVRRARARGAVVGGREIAAITRTAFAVDKLEERAFLARCYAEVGEGWTISGRGMIGPSYVR